MAKTDEVVFIITRIIKVEKSKIKKNINNIIPGLWRRVNAKG